MGTESPLKVGVLTDSISRQAGGLFGSVRSLSRGVQRAGFEVGVFTGRDAYTERDRLQWADLNVTVLAKRGPASFGYIPDLLTMLKGADLDVLHTQGLWMYSSLATVQWAASTGKPYLISPRGMLDTWAINNSAWKKRLAGWLYENAHLRGAACLHALCESEAQAIRGYGLWNPICVIPNGVELQSADSTPAEPVWARGLPAGAKILLFLGRLHPKKGIKNLLQAWTTVKQQGGPDFNTWSLVISGWDQGGHEGELKALATTLGIAEQVRFVGPQFEAEKAASLARADAFVLPSFSEGLPMAVLEAWSYRLPVVMTPQCNLPEGFAVGAALSIDTEAASIAQGLRALFAMTSDERQEMGERGRQSVEKRFTWPTVAASMCGVYEWLVGAADRPDCVLID